MDDLARMSEIPNDQRADWARIARQSGQSVDLPDGDTEVIADLLCDLHHWAVAHDVLWDEALARAEMHYGAERVIPADEALLRIATILSGNEWDAGTIETVAEIVRQAGIAVEDLAE